MSIALFLMFKMLSFYYENTQEKLKLHRENTENFAFRDEWDTCWFFAKLHKSNTFGFVQK